jgi:ElaA protein
MEWIIKKFDDLSPLELYTILQLRNEVFVVEQNCVFQDADNKDIYCHHVMGMDKGKLVAYSRIVPPGISYTEPSIGRIVTSPLARSNGSGKALMEKSIGHLIHLFGNQPIRIGAQVYLLRFYNGFGFEQSGDIYMEDGIEHVEMLRS